MLIFSIVIISLVGYFATHKIIEESFGRDFSGHLSREDIEDVEIPFEMEGCGPSGQMGGMDVYTSMLAVMQNIGFYMVAFFSNLAAVFLMMGLIPNELSKRSIYTLVSKPLTRTDIFIGKLLGGWAGIFVFTFILGLMFIIFMYLAGTPFIFKFLLVTIIGVLSPMLFGTLAFVLGTYFRSTAVGFFSIVLLFFSTDGGNTMIYLVGNMWLKWEKITDFVLGYLPPLPKIKALVGIYIDSSFFTMLFDAMEDFGYMKIYYDWWANALFVAGYIIVMIVVGWAIFRQREFN
jgi:ABC-type transport system involved in multi-copper enzyme maturation permease subunit